jgi:Protein of unknwon function (DUF3310)
MTDYRDQPVDNLIICSECGYKYQYGCIHHCLTPPDPVNPQHYKSHPSGIECIEIAEHFSFCLGNVLKYVWRVGMKGNVLENLKKARWYLDREIANQEKASENKSS